MVKLPWAIKEEAIRDAEKAVELYPISRDARVGRWSLYTLALVYAWTGERDRALQTISILVSSPGPFGYPEFFKLDPSFDSLRGDPRFGKILAQAPRTF